MSRKIQFACLFVLAGLLSATTQLGFAQADPPLNFANNYFVRGDYTVAGAQGMTSNFTNINGTQYAVGTITVPDTNPGIQPSVLPGINANGSNAVPSGAEVIAAVLYWQTVEKVGVMPGQPGSGQNGFFRPRISGGVAPPGYPISGVALSSGSNAVSWSSGGCTSGSTGKTVRTYRANVLGAMPRDASGNVLANNSYEVRLPGTSSTTPIAVGASLVLVYRVLNPTVPLNSIVIYDGDYANSSTALVMTQTMQGFYDAAKNAISRLTHIVGNGKAKKSETVYLNSVALPNLFPNNQPPFPGYYGMWDNTTWTFNPAEMVAVDSASVTTQVVPFSGNPGCVSWGATIFSTTVKSSWGDGLVDAWKKIPAGYSNPGYCDAAVNEGVCAPGSASWVDLPGAAPGQTDVYVQFDYMCSQVTGRDSCTAPTDGINYSFDPRLTTDTPAPPGDGLNAVQKVINAYQKHGITLHINPLGTNQPNVHAIQEPYCQDTTVNGKLSLCPFPNVLGTSVNMGVVTWPGGFYSIKSQLIDPDDPTNLSDCTTSPPAADCVPRFQSAAAPAKHYVLFGHAVGQPKWKLQGGTLVSAKQSSNTVTFTTSLPVGVLNIVGTDVTVTPPKPVPDPSCQNGRVTVIGAATNPTLDGTYCILNATHPLDTSFSISVGGSPMNTSYTLATDPNLALAPGFTSTASGVSDVGGANSYISLGLWGNPALSGLNALTSPPSDGQKATTIGGTFIHEFGHANGLAHGAPATYVALGLQSLQSVLTNCKANYQSSMSYTAQVEIVDYSSGTLKTLDKSHPGTLLTGSGNTNWYVPWPLAYDAHHNPIGSPATSYCNGAPIIGNAQMTLLGPLPLGSFSWNSPNPALPNSPDVNFDGNTSEQLLGATDWGYLDFGQIDTTGTNSSSSGGQFNGGGGQFNGGGGQFNGGGGQFNGGGGQFNGGGGQFNGGGGQFNGGGEIDEAIVNSVTRSPQTLTATESQSPRSVTLNWTAPFGQIGSYNIYRSPNGVQSFIKIATVSGNPPVTTYTDNNVACNPAGYQYFVTAVLSSASANPGQESAPSNTVSVTLPDQYLLTGCYTNTPNPVTPPTIPPAPTIVLNDLLFGPNPVVQGTSIPITWTLQDDNTSDYANPYVNTLAANSVVALGPFNFDGSCPLSPGANPPTIPLVTNGFLNAGGTSTFGVNAGRNYQFMLNWDTTLATAGCYFFRLTTGSGQTETTSALSLLIYVSGSGPHVTTTTLPNGVVGSAYSNPIFEAGGTPNFTWTIVAGALPPGFSFLPNPTTATQVALTGTPSAPGVYNFTAKVTDANMDYGTQALTLKIADALYGDLVVADGVPQVNPTGALYRITPTGTTGTIASISTGMPDGVAVDATTGNIYAAVAPVAGSGSPGIVQVGPFGGSSAFGPVGVLQSPVAVAVDSSSNVYAGDNALNAVYKFNSSGTQVDGSGNPTPNPLATLPSSFLTLNHIRMAFDASGNLFVGSDSIGGVSGVVELDKVDSSGNLTKLYTNPVLSDSLTAASAAVSGTTTYTGTFSPPIPANSLVTIAGFAHGVNNGPFTVMSSTGTTLVVNNPSGVYESAASASVTLTDSLSAAGNASSGTTTYTGTFSPPIPVNSVVTIAGFTNASNNGSFTVVSCDSATLVVNNAGGVSESAAATVTLTDSLTAASNASSGTTTYTGTISAVFPANSVVKIAGFTNAVNNNSFTVVSSTSTQLVVNNPYGVAEANPGTATLTLTPDIGPVAITEAVTAAGTAASGNTPYTGSFSPTIPANTVVTIVGFTNASNNGSFTVVSSTSTQLVVNNPNGVSETPNAPGTASFNLSAPIGSIGGVAALADGSIDIADPLGHAIYKVASPGTSSMAITTAIGPLDKLCCYLTGMANPPSQSNTNLYLTLNGVTDSANITSFAISSNVVTFQAANDFTPGADVQITGLSIGTYLNNKTLTVISSNGMEFQANFSNPDVPSTTDTGTATVTGLTTRLQQAVPQTSTVTTVPSTAPLTHANDVTWYDSKVTQ